MCEHTGPMPRKPPRYDVPQSAPEPLRTVQAFVNTVDLEHGREWLAVPADLERFLLEHGLGRDIRAGPDALRRARELREALRTLLVVNNRGDGAEAAFASLNAVARRGRLTVQFTSHGAATALPLAAGADGGLARIVAVAAASMRDGSWSRLKACRNCRWAFYDRSRNRSATWCSMILCGNRLKTRAYRRRHARG